MATKDRGDVNNSEEGDNLGNNIERGDIRSLGNDESQNGTLEFDKALEKNGLDPKYWSDKFMKTLNMCKINQIQYLTQSDIAKLIKDCREPWEQKALQKLMQTHDGSTEKLVNVVQEAKKINETFKTKTDKITQSSEKIRQMLKVPEEVWETQIKKADWDAVLKGLTHQVDKVDHVIDRSNLEDNEVITHASGGLALMGIYYTKNIVDILSPRKTIIDLKGHIHLKAPYNQQSEEMLESFSEELSSKTHRLINETGLGISAHATFLKPQFSNSVQREKKTDHSTVIRSTKQFYSKTKVCVIPIKSCELTFSNIYLIPEVIKKLQNMEKLIRFACREEFVNHECHLFYKCYGSHINLGLLHFGGIYSWIATYNGTTEENDSNIQDLVTKSLNGFIASNIPLINGLTGAETSVNLSGINAELSHNFTKSDKSNTSLRIMKCGGPPEFDDFYVWKYFLASCNRTWNLINRGELHGIWEVLKNHEQDFKDTNTLAKALEKAWKSTGTTEHNVDFNMDKTLLMEISNVIEDIEKWNSIPNTETVFDILERLVKCKDTKTRIEGSTHNWKQLVKTEIAFKEFFDNMVKLEKKLQFHEKLQIKHNVESILQGFSTAEIPYQLVRLPWTFEETQLESLENHLANQNITSVEELIDLIQRYFVPMIQAKIISKSGISEQDTVEIEEVQRNITKQFSQLCHKCFSELVKEKNGFEIVLLRCAVIPYSYDEDNYCFSLLTVDDIKRFLENTQTMIDNYRLQSGKPQTQIQSHTCMVILRTIQHPNIVGTREKAFDTCLDPIREKLTGEVTSVINNHAACCPYDWDGLEADFRLLQDGKAIPQPSFFLPDAQLTLEDQSLQSSDSPNTDYDKNLQQFMEELDLNEFYPNMITLTHAMKICLSYGTPKYSNVPWIFLKGLLASNYNSRGSMLKNYLKKLKKDTLDNLDSSDDEDGDVFEKKLNPLDLIVAVYKCSAPILKQIIAVQLFNCRLAVPIVFPPDQNERLEILTWAIGGIIIERKLNNSIKGHKAIEFPCHVVSFMRFDEIPASKSRILNYVLSNKNHEVFITSDSDLGGNKRTISEGLVEGAWKIPEQASENEEVTLFLNLRGDSKSFRKQCQFLCSVSSIVVIFIDMKELNSDRCKSFLCDIFQNKCNVLLLLFMGDLDKATFKTLYNMFLDSGVICQERMKQLSYCRIEKQKGLSDIYSQMSKKLCGLTKQSRVISLEERLHNNTYAVKDEQRKPYCPAIQRVEHITSLLHADEVQNKEKMLPLQGRPLVLLSDTITKLSKTSKYIPEEERLKMDRQITKLRKEQLELTGKLSPFTKDVISELLIASRTQQLSGLFIPLLKSFLDELCRKNLPLIKKDLHDSIRQFREACISGDEDKIEHARKHKKKCEDSFEARAIGFEHLLREIGQIYEAFTYINAKSNLGKDERKKITNYPKMCAKFILTGFPCEIMDGDAGTIPLAWVKAILHELEQEIGDNKILTVSVLGIQSSGKSTLLNTMFGVQFPVGAGRCTRGIFMQLLPVKGRDLKFRYVLVFDTEGLRVEALYENRYENDNKLATFVLGLGDITIINTISENNTAIKDTLQIVVNSFLRFQKVLQVRLDQGCVFVHQNVSEASVNDQLEYKQEQFTLMLDEITREAAEHEKIPDIRFFNEIIDFQRENDLWYFPGIWNGSPPMAARNPAYSEQAEKLKVALLTKKAKFITDFQTISDISMKIYELWNGILSDDYVFTFRNCLEKKAYDLIEKKYQNIAFELDKLSFHFFYTEVRRRIFEIKDQNEFPKKSNNIIKGFEKLVNDTKVEFKREVVEFVSSHSYKIILTQWKENMLLRLDSLVSNLILKMQLRINQTVEESKQEMFERQEEANYKKEIDDLANKLAYTYQGQLVSEDVLKEEFAKKWINWMTKFANREPPPSHHSIKDEVRTSAFSYFEDIAQSLNKELSQLDSKRPSSRYCLAGCIKSSDIKEEHVNVKPSYKRTFLNFIGRIKYAECKDKMLTVTDKLFEAIDEILKCRMNEDKNYERFFATEIFKKIKDIISTQNANEQHIIGNPYLAFVVAHVVQHMTAVFEKIEDKYLMKHSPKTRLQAYKETTWINFKGLVQVKTMNVLVVDVIEECLSKEIKAWVHDVIVIDIYGELKSKFPEGKSAIIKTMLSHLANEGESRSFFGYIKNPNSFVKKWLEEYTVLNIVRPIRPGNKSKYFEFAEPKIKQIFEDIRKGLLSLRTMTTDMSTSHWISCFVDEVNSRGKFPLSTDHFYNAKDKVVGDISSLHTILLGRLEKMKEDIYNHFEREDGNTITWKESPVDMIMNLIWGCKAICQFCFEPCKESNKNHFEKDNIPHSCIQHRIIGVAGHRTERGFFEFWMENETLTLETCTDMVRSKESFEVEKSDVKWRDYKKRFPDWDIKPHQNENKYWKWFVCQYKDNISHHYDLNIPHVPDSWSQITLQEAIASLKLN